VATTSPRLTETRSSPAAQCGWNRWLASGEGFRANQQGFQDDQLLVARSSWHACRARVRFPQFHRHLGVVSKVRGQWVRSSSMALHLTNQLTIFVR